MPVPVVLVGLSVVAEGQVAVAHVEGEVGPLVAETAKRKKTGLIDLHTLFEGKAEYFPDKIHPNGDGAALMAATVLKAIK